jgi:AraC-like DNA-binding protein
MATALRSRIHEVVRPRLEQVRSCTWPSNHGLDGLDIWCSKVGDLRGLGHSRRGPIGVAFTPHLVVSGRGLHVDPGGSTALAPGDVFFSWPGQAEHYQELPEDPWHFYYLVLEGEQTEAIVRALGYSPERLIAPCRQPQRAERCFIRLLEYYRLPSGREPFRAMALLFDLLDALSARPHRSPDPERDLVEEAMALAEDTLDLGITVTDLAQRLALSRQHLCTLFQRQVGCSPATYLLRLRRRRAEQLLQQTDWKVTAIAQACGYQNAKYFYRRFREWTGQSPQVWREAQQNAS